MGRNVRIIRTETQHVLWIRKGKEGFRMPGWGDRSLQTNYTHRRLFLPKVPQFRDWFGVSCLYCTLQSRLETTFRVFTLGIGYSSTPVTKPISEPGQTKEPGRNYTVYGAVQDRCNSYFSFRTGVVADGFLRMECLLQRGQRIFFGSGSILLTSGR